MATSKAGIAAVAIVISPFFIIIAILIIKNRLRLRRNNKYTKTSGDSDVELAQAPNVGGVPQLPTDDDGGEYLGRTRLEYGGHPVHQLEGTEVIMPDMRGTIS